MKHILPMYFFILFILCSRPIYGAELYEAVQSGNVPAVKKLISDGSDVNAHDVTGATALHYASYLGNEELIQILLDAKANINATDDIKFTPLHCAALNGNLKSVEKLILAGAKIDVTNSENMTPLKLTINAKHDDCTFFLICAMMVNNIPMPTIPSNLLTPERNKDIHLIQSMIRQYDRHVANKEPKFNDVSRGAFLLHAAISRQRYELGEIFLKLGVSPNSKNEHGELPLLNAMSRGDTILIRLLLSYDASTDIKDSRNRTLLMHCAGMPNTFVEQEIIPKLLKAGSDITAEDNHGWTALHYAAFYDSMVTLKLLIEAGADVNTPVNTKNNLSTSPEFHNTFTKYMSFLPQERTGQEIRLNSHKMWSASLSTRPIHLAALKNNKEMIAFLLEKGADPNLIDRFGLSLAHYAAINNDDELITTLTKKGVKMNQRDSAFMTPLNYALYVNNIEVVRTLLKVAPDDPNEIKDGISPFFFVLNHHNQDELIKELLAAGYTRPTLNSLRHKTPDKRFYERNLLYNFLVTLTRSNNISELKEYLKNEDELIKSGGLGIAPVSAFISPTNTNLHPLLHVAVIHDHPEMVEFLLKEGFDVNAVNTFGATALALNILHHKNTNSSAIFKLLIEAGADIHSVNLEGSEIPAFLKEHMDSIKEKPPIKKEKPDMQLFTLIQQNRILEVQKKIKEGVSVKLANSSGHTPLHYAAFSAHTSPAIYSALIEAGADVNAQDVLGRTPLFFLCARSSPINVLPNIDILLKAGADVNIKCISGATAMHMCAIFFLFGKHEGLLKYGADLSMEDFWGEKPEDYARARGFPKNFIIMFRK